MQNQLLLSTQNSVFSEYYSLFSAHCSPAVANAWRDLTGGGCKSGRGPEAKLLESEHPAEADSAEDLGFSIL